jgi:hypothetical protein
MDIVLIGALAIVLCGIAVLFVATLAVELHRITRERREGIR